MLSDDVMSRLSRLNRANSPLGPPAVSAAAEPAGLVSVSSNVPDAEDISKLPPGREIENTWGRHWLRERRLSQIWPHGEQWLSREIVRQDMARDCGAPLASDLCALLAATPTGVLYLDLETCGFAGSMIFLVGLIHEQQGELVLSQLLARNYSEEKAVLQTFWTIADDKRVLVTFNGKSFDWPMVHDRSTVHHLGHSPSQSNVGDTPRLVAPRCPRVLTRDEPRPDLLHCDLLHHARRRWKRNLPDCRLQTLERYICRRRREEDVSGQAIPAAYHDFVRSGDAWLMRGVLHHNALDLITLLQLSIRVVQ